MRTLLSRLRQRLLSPVDGASLVFFRIAFGVIMLWEIIAYFQYGWIQEYWIDPPFHFTYPGFDWVQPWPGNGMYIHMAVLGVLAVCVAVGFCYRASATLFFLGFAYTFLLERARYLNHFYFVCLVSLLMIFVPAHRACSLDARWRPQVRSTMVPRWSLWLLRFQLGVVYFYSGMAKLNSDWWQGEPLRSWLAPLHSAPFVGPLFTAPATFTFVAWAGMCFDLFIVPLLLWRRTRPFAFAAALCFHVTNAWFFTIGIFPWFSIAMTTLFFEPDWPRRVIARMRNFWGKRLDLRPSLATRTWVPTAHPRLALTLLGVYAAFQLLFPLRHWLYPGDVAWTEEGHEFSWRMKLRGKVGQARFVVRNPATQELWFEMADGWLMPWQAKKMNTRPDLLRQFARHLATVTEKKIGAPVKVRVESSVRLNGHTPGPLVLPEADLSDTPYELGPSKWITKEPSASEDVAAIPLKASTVQAGAQE